MKEDKTVSDDKSSAKEKLIEFAAKHKNIWLLIQFALVGLLTAVVEFISFFILAAALRSVDSPMRWFIFEYSQAEGGRGAMISYLSSVTVAQVVAFVVKRKKVFKADNNLAFSIIAYAVLVAVFVIGLQVYAAPYMINLFGRFIGDLMWASSFAKISLMVISFPIVFLSSKFVVFIRKKV